MRVLNCNNENGDIITENTARVMFYGRLDSIANIYIGSRVEENDKLSHFLIDGIVVPKEYAKSFYIALWWQFFKENSEVLKNVLSYDEYKDDIPEGVINSPAKVFKILKQGGLNGLGSNCEKFLVWLRSERQKADIDDFSKLKRQAEGLVNKNIKDKSKEEIIDIARIQGDKIFVSLVSICYDKKDESITDSLYNMQVKRLKKEFEGTE